MAKERRSLHGKVVAITGGARGIGKATAIALTRRGCRVAIGDLDLELAEKTAQELGGGAVALKLDVTDRESFTEFLDETERQLGPLDVLINNAGIMPLGRFADEDDATARRMIDINLHGVIFGTKLALARMEPRNTGHIVNLASQAGKGGFPGGATYCATKHGVVGLSEAVRAELDGTDIGVSVVMPAIVNTELAAGLKEARGVKNLEPEEVADAIVEALETARFEVWVPRSTKYIATVMNIVPRRGREAIARFLKADKVLADADPAARASYEDRAAHSEPGVEPEGERVSAKSAD
jgi:NADP-dependent 3-hydroxy acid dehydrogenase YdfG